MGPAKLSGLAKLARRLDPGPAVQPALADAGEEIVRQAEAAARSQGLAHLAQSLRVLVSTNRVEAGSDHPDARAAEFGTLHNPPKPWLQPAFQAALGPVRTRLRQALRDHLTQRQRRAR